FTIQTSLWFIPGLITASAIGLSFLTIHLDRTLQREVTAAWGWTGSAEGARALLSTVAGSMITVAGVVFSITMVVFTLASSQFGPRLLVTFLRDRGNQFVLGTFLATFLYSLLV